MWNFNSHHEIPFVIKTPVFLWVDWIGKRSLRLASTSVQEFSWINNNSHKMNFVRSSALDLTKKSSALDLTEKNPNLRFLHVCTRFYKENRAKLSTIGFLLTRFQAMQPIINGINIVCVNFYSRLWTGFSFCTQIGIGDISPTCLCKTEWHIWDLRN